MVPWSRECVQISDGSNAVGFLGFQKALDLDNQYNDLGSLKHFFLLSLSLSTAISQVPQAKGRKASFNYVSLPI